MDSVHVPSSEIAERRIPYCIGIVDDDADFLNLLTDAARVLDLDISGFASFESFRGRVRELDVDLVLVDLDLGGFDGISVLELLAQYHIDVPVVPISGHNTRILQTAAGIGRDLGLNVCGALSKPFRIADLTKLVDAIPPEKRAIRAVHLEHGLALGDVVPAYQPIVATATGRVAGVEMLARWYPVARPPISPDVFIPLAERSGTIERLTFELLEATLRECRIWQRCRTDLQLSVNIAAEVLSGDRFIDRLIECLDRHRFNPARLTLELTERTAMARTADTAGILTRLRLRGIHLSIDDFGTGYSSLAELHGLPFSELKIDRSFIAGLGRDPEARTIVQAVTTLAHNLGLTPVAEGIEAPEGLAVLREIGTDLAQGYLFGRPTSGIEFGGSVAETCIVDRPAARCPADLPEDGARHIVIEPPALLPG